MNTVNPIAATLPDPADSQPGGFIERLRPEPDGVPSPLVMLDRAIARGADLTMIEKLMDFQERHERNEARRAFDRAIAAVRAEIPTIAKNREVDFTTAKGRTNYRHEDLAGIAKTIDPVLAEHGLSYRFRTTAEPNEPITVTCIVSHELGHREENTLRAGRDESGNKNSIQAIGSTITYLQRYTLKASLGLAASADDDGGNADSDLSGEGITPARVMEMREALTFIGRTEEQFLSYANNRLGLALETLEAVPVEKADDVQGLINGAVQAEKRRRAAKEGNAHG